jgi:hypothetical protein
MNHLINFRVQREGKFENLRISVGDSALPLIRKGTLVRITDDQIAKRLGAKSLAVMGEPELSIGNGGVQNITFPAVAYASDVGAF